MYMAKASLNAVRMDRHTVDGRVIPERKTNDRAYMDTHPFKGQKWRCAAVACDAIALGSRSPANDFAR